MTLEDFNDMMTVTMRGGGIASFDGFTGVSTKENPKTFMDQLMGAIRAE